MRRRLQVLLGARPDAPPPPPNLREGLCAFSIGLVWTLGCVWLAGATAFALLPLLLVGGVLLLWGWRYLEWLGWFPLVLVSISFFEPWIAVPFPIAGVRFSATHLLVAGLALLALVRAIGLSRRIVPRTPVDAGVLATAALVGITALIADTHAAAITLCLNVLVAVALFYTATTVASRPGGAQRVWPVFPAVMVALGVRAIIDWTGLDRSRTGADLAGASTALLLALPVTLGLALDAGRSAARVLWRCTLAVGLVGLVHVATTAGSLGPNLLERLSSPLGFALTAIGWSLLGTVARLALRVRAARDRERVRWFALALTFAGVVLIQALGYPVDAPNVLVLLATGSGLAVGAYRVELRKRAALATWAKEHASVPAVEAGPDTIGRAA